MHATTDGRRRIRGWMAFDWASQPFFTLCLTFVFGPYFAEVVAADYLSRGLSEQAADAEAQATWSRMLTLIGLGIAVTAPFLGALADRSGRHMRWIGVFSIIYVAGLCGLWAMVPDGSGLLLASIAFGMAMIGAEYATIFTNAMLPALAPRGDIGRISGSGYALGYAGGVTSLAIMLLLFVDDAQGRTFLGGTPALGLDGAAREGTRAVGPFAALWYVVFMIPFFAWVSVPRAPAVAGPRLSLRQAGRDVAHLLRQIPGRRSLAAYLAGSMLYRDALAALYSFGGIYAVLVLDWETTQIGVFGILGAVTAAVASWIGGRLDGAHGPKPVIVGAILVLSGVVAVLATTSREAIVGLPLAPGSAIPDIAFYVIGAVIGGAGGVLQAASRTLMVRHAVPGRETEAFGLYALAGKATAFVAPAAILVMTEATGSARLGILPVAFLFLAGLVLLRWVDPDGDT